MTEFLLQAKEILILYAPLVLTGIGTIINYLSVFKKFKDLKVKENIEEALTTTKSDIDELIVTTRRLAEENKALRGQVNTLISALTKVEANYDKFNKKK